MNELVNEIKSDLDLIKKDSVFVKAERAEKVLYKMNVLLSLIVVEIEKLKGGKNASLG